MLFMTPAQALELAGDKPDWLPNQQQANQPNLPPTAGQRSEDAIRRLISDLSNPNKYTGAAGN